MSSIFVNLSRKSKT